MSDEVLDAQEVMEGAINGVWLALYYEEEA